MSEKECVSGKLGFDLPIVDLDQCAEMQFVVDKEDKVYLGHPSMELLEDKKSLICVYPCGYGKGPIYMKKSCDGGKTWSDRLSTPKSWETSADLPTIYSTVDKDDKKRLLIFSGSRKNVRMAVSEDEGNTWSELEPIGNYPAIVAMADCIELNEKGHYLATLHTRVSGVSYLQTIKSTDGGVTWSRPKNIYITSEFRLCEAGALRSPDGEELVLLIRDNSRKANGYFMFSNDEGESWSEPVLMPGALAGDRHQAVYLPDGRILIEFRDVAPTSDPKFVESPTSGDWVGWVGSWEDIKNGYEGEYRIRFKDNILGHDAAYPTIKVLSDNTIASVSYGHWTHKESPYLLCFRFKIGKLDKIAKDIRKNGQTPIKNERGDRTAFIYDPNNIGLMRNKIAAMSKKKQS